MCGRGNTINEHKVHDIFSSVQCDYEMIYPSQLHTTQLLGIHVTH